MALSTCRVLSPSCTALNPHSISFTIDSSVKVYPVGADITLESIVKLRDKPLRKDAFILDVHLGKLARMLRMLGFDTVYEIDYDVNHSSKSCCTLHT